MPDDIKWEVTIMSEIQKKKVLLLTNKFPYGIVETFIEAELEAIPEDIDLTIVPTQAHAASDQGRPVPETVKVDNVLNNRPKYEYPLKSFQMMFSKIYRDEIRERKQKGAVSLQDRIHLIGYFGRAKQIADVVTAKYGNEDVVLYSYWATEASYAEKLIKLRKGYKSVTRAHRTDVYDGHCAYGTIPGQREAVAGIDKVYVCSKDGRDYLQSKYPESRDKITYSYLGTRDYGFQSGDNRADEFVIASCSRLVPVKRVHLLAEALKSITDMKIHWIHIGDGAEREKVDAIVKTLPDNIRVTFTGNMPHDDVMEYYRDHDVNLFVNVSESEGLPVSIMEVVSFGIPVVATDVGGTGEVVDKSIGDLIPKEFTAEEIVVLIRKYADMDTSSYQQQRGMTRQFWEDNYSAANNYRKFYHEITQR